MRRSREEKYERFKSILIEPYDNDRSGTFPIFTGSRHFDLSQYAAESANHPVEMFDNVIKALPDELFLDLGCGYREITYDNCLYIEVYPSRSADLIVEPNCLYPIKSGSLRAIGCFAVLEHTRKPWLVVQEMQRMLKPGGQVFIDWPFLQPVHGYPSHFFNATREGLTSVFEDAGFATDMAYTGIHQTAAYTIQWILGRFAHHLKDPELRHEFAQMTVSDLVAMSQQDPLWWKFLNGLPPDRVLRTCVRQHAGSDKDRRLISRGMGRVRPTLPRGRRRRLRRGRHILRARNPIASTGDRSRARLRWFVDRQNVMERDAFRRLPRRQACASGRREPTTPVPAAAGVGYQTAANRIGRHGSFAPCSRGRGRTAGR